MILEKKKISELTPAPYNPRRASKQQEDNLKASLTKFGVVEPIIFNKRTGYIVGGHFRVRELQKLGVKEVECVIVDLSPEDEKELNIRLNANTGEFDFDMLQDWDISELAEWGLEVPEWDEEENFNPNLEPETNYSDVTKEQIKKEAEKLASQMIKQKKKIECMCPDCGHEFEIDG